MGGQHREQIETIPALEQIQQVIDTAVNPFVLLNRRGRVLWASQSIEELLGHHPDDMVGLPMLAFIAPSSHADAIATFADAVDDGPPGDGSPGTWEGVGPVYEMQRADGSSVRCAFAAATPARTGLDCFVLQLRRADATAALEDLLLSMGTGQPLSEVLDNVAAVLVGELPDADVVLFHRHRDAHRFVVSGDAGRLTDDHDIPALAGEVWERAAKEPGAILHHAVDELPADLRALATTRGYRWLTLMGAERLTDDEDLPAMVTVWSRSPHPMHRLNHDRVVRCGRLLTVALRWEWGRRALEWAATHDVLTGLHNRASFMHELRHVHLTGRRSADRAAVLYLDLDDFKPVNEDHGHALGDRVLVEVAARLRRSVRPSDIVARLGGDEFAVLCPGLDDLTDAQHLASRLVHEIRQPISVEDVEVHIGLSVGITALNDTEDAERVLHRADGALRAAKLQGKSRWKVA